MSEITRPEVNGREFGFAELISRAFSRMNRNKATRKVAEPVLSYPTEDRLTYSEPEFRAASAQAESDILAAEEQDKKRIIRVYQINPDAITNERHAQVPGTVHMVSKDNVHGIKNGLFGK